MNKRTYHIVFVYFIFCINYCLGQNQTAPDTIKSLGEEKIEVIKQFEASLMEAEMIFFRPTLPEVIPISRIYEYDVTIIPYPIEYPAPTIRPIAMKGEPPKELLRNYAKIGYGNIKNPLAEIRLSRKFADMVDWRFSLNYHSADNSDDFPLQKFSNWNVSSSQDFTVMETERLATTIGGGLETRNFYYNGSDLTEPLAEDAASRDISRFNLDLVFYNAVDKDLKLDYSVQWKNHFTSISDLNKSEINSVFMASATKTSHENMRFTFGGGIDYNRIDDYSNVLSFINPKFILVGDKYNLKLGVDIVQGDGALNIFPDIELDYAIDHKKLQIYLGSNQNYIRNNYHNVTLFNPFAIGMDSLKTSITADVYGGAKGNISGLIYNAKAGYKILDNFATYNVDFNDPQRRIQTNVTKLNSVYISGSLKYPVRKWVTIGANTTQNFYSNIESDELWSIPSLEFSAFAELSLFKDKIIISPTIFLRDRANALDFEQNNIEMDDLIDFSIQLELRPVQQVSAWIRGNNLFDKSYRRWYGYENFGIHIQAGIKTIF